MQRLAKQVGDNPCSMCVQQLSHNHTKGNLSRAVFIKAARLRREGKSMDQALAMAASMEREGRLTKRGHYLRVGAKRGR